MHWFCNCRNYNCEWNITTRNPGATILIRFLFVDVDTYKNKCYDKVTIYEGIVSTYSIFVSTFSLSDVTYSVFLCYTFAFKLQRVMSLVYNFRVNRFLPWSTHSTDRRFWFFQRVYVNILFGKFTIQWLYRLNK